MTVGTRPTTRGNTTCRPLVVHHSSMHAVAEQEDTAKPTPRTFTNKDTNTATHSSAHSRAASHSTRTIGAQRETRANTTCQPLVVHHSNMCGDVEQEDIAKPSPKPCTEHDKQISSTKHTAYNPIQDRPLDQKTTIAGNTTCQPHVVQSGNNQVTMEQANIAKPRPMTFIKHTTETAILMRTYGLQAHPRMSIRPETTRSNTTCQTHVAQSGNKHAAVEQAFIH